MKKEKELKYDEKSYLVITRKVGTKLVEDINTGEALMVDDLRKERVFGDLNLGSLKDKTNIVHFKYVIPPKIKLFWD